MIRCVIRVRLIIPAISKELDWAVRKRKWTFYSNLEKVKFAWNELKSQTYLDVLNSKFKNMFLN